MNSISTLHRTYNGKVQTITIRWKDTDALHAATAPTVANYYQYVFPLISGVTPPTFELDSEVMVPSDDTSNTTAPNKVWYSVTVEDTDKNSARNYLLKATVDYNAGVTPGIDFTGCYVALELAFQAAQSTSVSPKLKLDDPKVWVDTIIVQP